MSGKSWKHDLTRDISVVQQCLQMAHLAAPVLRRFDCVAKSLSRPLGLCFKNVLNTDKNAYKLFIDVLFNSDFCNGFDFFKLCKVTYSPSFLRSSPFCS